MGNLPNPFKIRLRSDSAHAIRMESRVIIRWNTGCDCWSFPNNKSKIEQWKSWGLFVSFILVTFINRRARNCVLHHFIPCSILWKSSCLPPTESNCERGLTSSFLGILINLYFPLSTVAVGAGAYQVLQSYSEHAQCCYTEYKSLYLLLICIHSKHLATSFATFLQPWLCWGHQELLALGQIHEYHPSFFTIFVSHQWLGGQRTAWQKNWSHERHP